jgi:hypothetical protein
MPELERAADHAPRQSVQRLVSAQHGRERMGSKSPVEVPSLHNAMTQQRLAKGKSLF